MKSIRALLFLVILAGTGTVSAAEPRAATPLAQAHAHNDYLHPRPLQDALDHGFCSVEADIYLIQGQLLVAHDRDKVKPERTLESLYLIPLQQRARRFQGDIYPHGPAFTLLIDIKSEAKATYAVLRPVLQRYTNLLTRFEHNRIHTNAVTVVLSGNRPWTVLEKETSRHAALDGRITDLATNPPLSLVPLISDNWTRHFRWRGQGALSPAETDRLKQWVEQAHTQGRRLRFWAIPDQENAWRVMREHGVDLINTDRLADLEQILR